MASFEQLLNENYKWPCEYMYKFIVPTEKIESLLDLFSEGTPVKKTPSKNNKFTSLSIMISCNSSKEVLMGYDKAKSIKGVISL